MIILRCVIALPLIFGSSFGQQYLISTIAGGAVQPTPVAGTSASTGYPGGVAADAAGNVYFTTGNSVFRLDRTGALNRVAGSFRSGYSGDGGPASDALLNLSCCDYGLAVDNTGNLYIADAGNARIRRVTLGGIISTVAGNGTFGYSGDGGPATSAQLYNRINGTQSPPIFAGIAIDGTGNLFIAETFNSRIRKVSPTGIISTVAGNGTIGFSGDGGPAISATLNRPDSIAVDGAGNLYIADVVNGRIRKVSTDGTITTVSSNGDFQYAGAITLDAAANLYVADPATGRIRKISPGGTVGTVAGNGTEGFSGDGGPATNAQLGIQTGVLGFGGIAVDGAGNLYIADHDNQRIRKVTPGGTITTIAGNGSATYAGDGGPGANDQLRSPVAVAVDGLGNLFFADDLNYSTAYGIRKVSANGTSSTVVGNQTPGYSGDGGPASRAQLGGPSNQISISIAADSVGNLYIADSKNARIRKVSTSGNITTIAGNGTFGFTGDGGPATSAQLVPRGVTVDGAGNIYFTDYFTNRIRKVSSGGTITTVVGSDTKGYSGDGGPAVNAQLNVPMAIASDSASNLYIADTGNVRIRKVSSTGIITTVAGNGSTGYSGDGGSAINAQIGGFGAVSVDAVGNLYFVNEGNRVRKVSPAGIISTIAGNGSAGYSGDGGPATNGQMNANIGGIAVDGAGNVYFADLLNNAIRMLRPAAAPFGAVQIAAVLDVASESAIPISPGKIVVIYGTGIGPAALAQNQPANGAFGTQVGGVSVAFNGIPAPMIYSYATQVAAIAPYGISGSSTSKITVTYNGQTSSPFTVPVAVAAPSFFSVNGSGAGQAAAVNVDGSINDPLHPVKVGGYISLYVTGEGQTIPAGVDGKLALAAPYPQPALPVKVTVGGVPSTVAYAGAAPTLVAGLMQVVIQIPQGVQPGGYVPIALQVGNNSTVDGAAWIAVTGN